MQSISKESAVTSDVQPMTSDKRSAAWTLHSRTFKVIGSAKSVGVLDLAHLIRGSGLGCAELGEIRAWCLEALSLIAVFPDNCVLACNATMHLQEVRVQARVQDYPLEHESQSSLRIFCVESRRVKPEELQKYLLAAE